MNEFWEKIYLIEKQQHLKSLEVTVQDHLALLDSLYTLYRPYIPFNQTAEGKSDLRPKVNQTECIAFRNQFVDAFAEEAKVK